MAKMAEDTPLIKQFFEVKAQHPEALLLYRVGDFYETYSDDAVTASRVLGLVQTKKSNGDKGPIPMAGFPHHAIENYLTKLVRAGFKVAICDQLEDPKFAKKLVKRGVTEIVTPGISFGENMLEIKENNFLCGLAFERDLCGAAFLDVSTGQFQVAQGSLEYIGTLMGSLSPKELVVPRSCEKGVKDRFGNYYVTSLDEWAFVYDAAVEKLKRQLRVDSLKGFAVDTMPLGICAAGALMVYLEQTQHVGLRNISTLGRIDEAKVVWMDPFTLRNLEVFQAASGREGVSLVQTVDRCSSPMGARMLRGWLAMPILDRKELNQRYDIVQFFVDRPETLAEVQEELGKLGDLDRILGRIANGKALPREVLQLSRGLAQMKPLQENCIGQGCEAVDRLMKGLVGCDKILKEIVNTLDPDPASQIGKGPVIAEGVDEDLDELRGLSGSGKDYLLQMQQREAERTGIPSLRIAYNNVFGYYIEVRNTFKDKVPPEWIRKQTLVNAERYITEELKEYEEKIVTAESRIYEIETRLYANLIAHIQESITAIQKNSRILAKLDVLAGFAEQAVDRHYCRPVVDDSLSLDIKAGRHPVIETLMPAGEEYVPNDVFLDSKTQQIIILTGPNMAGKSALLRQTALIVLLAQTGSFVPAAEARIGYFDKIFTRVGATDNISRGESTFMVEMLETSMILHNLSARSLVLLDEIGRGTSTYDGMAIARAVLEYCADKRRLGAKTMFATHYHELSALEGEVAGVRNYNITAKKQGGTLVFLRKIVRGAADDSYGIEVAKLAGLPDGVIGKAKGYLKELSGGGAAAISSGAARPRDGQISLSDLGGDEVRDILCATDLNTITPIEAMNLLFELQRKARG